MWTFSCFRQYFICVHKIIDELRRRCYSIKRRVGQCCTDMQHCPNFRAWLTITFPIGNGRRQVSSMKEPEGQTWRSFIGQIILDSQEKQRLIDELHINPVTPKRWADNQATPRMQTVIKLVKALPKHRTRLLELLSKEFGDITIPEEEEIAETASYEIPGNFYAEVIRLYTTALKHQRFWDICKKVLPDALERLDPDHLGMSIMVARCMKPNPGEKVRSLREIIGRGTNPWEPDLDKEGVLL